jgi:hypothetical protein
LDTCSFTGPGMHFERESDGCYVARDMIPV